jgi:hypothetical protein
MRGAQRVAKRAAMFAARSPSARVVRVDGAAGIAVGRPSLVMAFGLRHRRITHVDIVTTPARLSKLDITPP